MATAARRVMSGALETAGGVIGAGQRGVLAPGEDLSFTAREASEALSFGGAGMGQRFVWWNFASSRRERIEDAKADWTAGRFKLPDSDNAEFIPLPADHERPLFTLNAAA